jgi:endoglucanase
LPKAATLAVSALALLAPVLPAYAGAEDVWRRYKEEFIQHDGRVIDYGQDHVSHSESQGYAMTFAVMFDDREAFDRIWRWTRDNLRVRADGLFAWQWGRRDDGRWTVLDDNNATDGDMLIAHALLRAEQKWPGGGLGDAGRGIVRVLREKMAASWRGRKLLLPGEKGFRKKEGVVINPSYIILPVYRRFAAADDAGFWKRLEKDGLALLEQCRFGPRDLPADWVLLSPSGPKLYDKREPEYGASAVRVPLHSALENPPRITPGAAGLIDVYKREGRFPARVDLLSGTLSERHASAGSYAVYGLVAATLGELELSARILAEAEAKLAREKREYYSMSLYLLAAGPRSHWN